MMTIANFDEAKKAAFAEGKEGLLAEVAKFEKMLIGEGDRFTESGVAGLLCLHHPLLLLPAPRFSLTIYGTVVHAQNNFRSISFMIHSSQVLTHDTPPHDTVSVLTLYPQGMTYGEVDLFCKLNCYC